MDFGPHVPWITCRSIHVRNRKCQRQKSFDSGLLTNLSLTLRSSFEEQMWTSYVWNPCPILYLLFTLVWSPHEENNTQLSSACLGFSYLFGSQTQKLRSKDGAINPLTHKNKTWYFHKATKKRHLVWLSYSPEFSPEVRGKGSYISQHGHSIHLYDWKRMFLFALHYTHKFHPLSKSNYCWPPKYIKFGFKSVTFEDLQQPTS